MPHSIHVAVADDHQLIRDCLVNSLNANGDFCVDVEASDCNDLLAQIRTLTKMPDVFLMDISMKGMNGIDATKELTKQHPQAKVLAVTMFGDDVNVLRMLQSGACGYFTKDKGMNELCKAVKDVVQFGYYHTPQIEKALRIIADNRKEKCDKFMLTNRELSFLSLCCSHLTYRQIAAKLFVSPHSIQNIVEEICNKIRILSRVELAIFAMRIGIEPYVEE